MDKLQAGLRAARDARATAGTTWDKALQALKRGTRAAADDGAPGLYKALFGHTRPKRKALVPAPVPQAHTGHHRGLNEPSVKEDHMANKKQTS